MKGQQLLFEAFFDIIIDIVEHESKSTFQFQNIIISKPCQSLGPFSSTPEGDRHVRSLSFSRKFNSQQLLSEAFFDIIGILRSIEA